MAWEVRKTSAFPKPPSCESVENMTNAGGTEAGLTWADRVRGKVSVLSKSEGEKKSQDSEVKHGNEAGERSITNCCAADKSVGEEHASAGGVGSDEVSASD